MCMLFIILHSFCRYIRKLKLSIYVCSRFRSHLLTTSMQKVDTSNCWLYNFQAFPSLNLCSLVIFFLKMYCILRIFMYFCFNNSFYLCLIINKKKRTKTINIKKYLWKITAIQIHYLKVNRFNNFQLFRKFINMKNLMDAWK